MKKSPSKWPVVGQWHSEHRTNVTDKTVTQRIDLTSETGRDNLHPASLMFG